MKAARLTVLALASALVATALWAPAASAQFGLSEARVEFTDENGEVERQAGAHPFAMTTTLAINATVNEDDEELPEGEVKDLRIEMPAGFAGDPRAVERCSSADFVAVVNLRNACPDVSVLGLAAVKFAFDPVPVEKAESFLHVPVYNLEPAPGTAAKLGFVVLGVAVTIDVGVNPNPPYNVIATLTNISQAALFYASETTLWGDPSGEDHDHLRGNCLDIEAVTPAPEPVSLGDDCSVDIEERAFLTMPRSCEGPLQARISATAWHSGVKAAAIAPIPGMTGCAKLGFGPEIAAKPTSEDASSPTGLDFALRVDDPGLRSPAGLADSDIERARVTLPEGMTINPSQAEGLEACSPSELADESATSRFGAGCPAASKIGTIEVETPLLEGEILRGSLFVATPHDNLAGDALIAFYIVIKHPERGIFVRQAARVDPDPRTGQLVTTTEDMPQQPFSEFRLRFREGGRSPLITPPRCGDYEVEARFAPWADSLPSRTSTSPFEVSGGPGGGGCPTGEPFAPGFSAGTVNNAAASHSPFHMRLTRRDGDQDLVRFDATLPPGVSARLAGVARCPQAAIEAAKDRDGKDELTRPSCPPASRIGTAIGGAGVGSQLTYVHGSIYMAGPFGGAPLSVVAIVPAVAGPFDVGTVVTQQALRVDPRTAQVTADGSLSDPIPHILQGIPLSVRDIRVHVDRPGFALNPTSCAPMAVLASIWGGGGDPFSLADDAPLPLAAPFQAAGCARLGFAPRLGLSLKGGTRRGAFPALRAVYRPRAGHANIKRLALRFPRSAFIEQGHFRTICTRVQYAANACPKGSIYGRARAFTPLLDAPLEGPVYLRSSDNDLPDAVFALKGTVDVEAVVRIDSARGGLRATVTAAPDVPVSRVVVNMRGGQKGLFVNSRDLCKGRNRATAQLDAHSGKRRALRPVVRALGCKKRGAKRPGRGRR